MLPGITYDVVLELAQANGLPLEVRPITEAEVRSADEIWVTSSTKEVLAVTTLDEKAGRQRQAGRGVSPDAPALPGVQADGDAPGRVKVYAASFGASFASRLRA